MATIYSAALFSSSKIIFHNYFIIFFSLMPLEKAVFGYSVFYRILKSYFKHFSILNILHFR